jgi:hypothetical protein
MQMLSEDDLNLREASADELVRAWDLWFDLAQSTNADDPPYTHGVFVGLDGRHDRGSDDRQSARNPPSATTLGTGELRTLD